MKSLIVSVKKLTNILISSMFYKHSLLCSLFWGSSHFSYPTSTLLWESYGLDFYLVILILASAFLQQDFYIKNNFLNVNGPSANFQKYFPIREVLFCLIEMSGIFFEVIFALQVVAASG